MKNRTILTLLLACMSTSAMAEWVRVSEGDDGNIYIDTATIKKDGNLRKVWTLYDLKTRSKSGEMSMQSLNEYDCKEERTRAISLTSFSKQMGEGKALSVQNGSGEWQYLGPESAGRIVMERACKEVVAAPTQAEYVYLGETSDGTSIYIATASIRKDGNLRRVWELNDHKQKNNKHGYRSVRYFAEYNCIEGRYRLLEFTAHIGQMATGKVVHSNDTPEMVWKDIQQNSPSATKLKLVCAK